MRRWSKPQGHRCRGDYILLYIGQFQQLIGALFFGDGRMQVLTPSASPCASLTVVARPDFHLTIQRTVDVAITQTTKTSTKGDGKTGGEKSIERMASNSNHRYIQVSDDVLFFSSATVCCLLLSIGAVRESNESHKHGATGHIKKVASDAPSPSQHLRFFSLPSNSAPQHYTDSAPNKNILSLSLKERGGSRCRERKREKII